MIKKIGVNGQFSIPREFMTKLGLKPEALMDIHIEGNKIILEQKISVPIDQAYFFSPEWQADEKEAQKDIAAGHITKTETISDLLDILDGKKKAGTWDED